MQIPNMRLLNQQLINPSFLQPKELIAWLGAMQAQNYGMVKWAVGMRLKSGTIQVVEKALQQGDVLRTHVMRPTWHLVAAEDIRWMLKLSAKRIKAANDSYAKGLQMEMTEALYTKSNNLLEKILCDKQNLTRQEIAERFCRMGIQTDSHRMNRFMARAELEGVVCSGADKEGKQTYMLLEERVPPMPELTKDEALAHLARKYFRSHAPATLRDFIWWSGLSMKEAKQAVYLIEAELTVDKWNEQLWYIHETSRANVGIADSVHLLPSYDEYLLGYKDRTDVLPKEYYLKAFTNNGLFFPIILCRGQVVGNWDKPIKKGDHTSISHSLFRVETPMSEELLSRSKEKYMKFYC